MSKVRFIISVEVELEDGSPELQHACECAGARFLENLEANTDANLSELRKKNPDCRFEVGGGKEGEEWRE